MKQNNPYSNTYNLGWKNHPNFSWKDKKGKLLNKVNTKLNINNNNNNKPLRKLIGRLPLKEWKLIMLNSKKKPEIIRNTLPHP